MNTLLLIAGGLEVPYESLLSDSPLGMPSPNEGGPPASDPPPGGEWWAPLVGRWRATIDQPIGPGDRAFHGDLEIEFFPCGAEVAGRYFFTYKDFAYECRLDLEFLFERYFKFDATATSPANARMYNTAYLLINPAGDEITGWYAGHGPHTGGIMYGRFTAEPINRLPGVPESP